MILSICSLVSLDDTLVLPAPPDEDCRRLSLEQPSKVRSLTSSGTVTSVFCYGCKCGSKGGAKKRKRNSVLHKVSSAGSVTFEQSGGTEGFLCEAPSDFCTLAAHRILCVKVHLVMIYDVFFFCWAVHAAKCCKSSLMTFYDMIPYTLAPVDSAKSLPHLLHHANPQDRWGGSIGKRGRLVDQPNVCHLTPVGSLYLYVAVC